MLVDGGRVGEGYRHRINCRFLQSGSVELQFIANCTDVGPGTLAFGYGIRTCGLRESGADEETKGAGMSAGTSVGAAAPPQAMTETNAAVISISKKNAGKFIGFTPRENYFNWGIITPAAGF